MELIKKAYGQSWLLCQPFTDDNGWCVVFKDDDSNFKGIAGYQTHFKEDEIEGGQLTHSVHGKGISFRPKSLHGIEHNNGWTKIEFDGSNLPEPGCYYFLNIDNIKDDGRSVYQFDDLRKDQFARWFTHFKEIPEIPKIPKPLY